VALIRAFGLANFDRDPQDLLARVGGPEKGLGLESVFIDESLSQRVTITESHY